MSSAPYFSGDDRFMRLDRSRWSHLADEISVPLSAEEIESLRGLGETVDLEEVRRIYLPISRLLNLYVTAASSLNHMTNDFLHLSQRRVPFIIGVAGSVAVGKSTTARILQALLSRWPLHPERSAGDDGRISIPQGGVAATRHHAPQGIPGVLRSSSPAGVRF